MRVIAGVLGGRQFASAGQRTHPMSDKIRGALFNALGDIQGLAVLDAFSGTGAVAFEAISRGAASALAIESDKAAQRTITQNVKMLELSEVVKLVKAGAGAWLQTYSGPQFDIVICDPPYHDPQLPLVKRLAGTAKPGGLVVLSWPGREQLPELPQCELASSRSYGDAQLAFYRKKSKD